MEPRAALIKTSFDTAQMVFNAVVGDLDEETARYTLPGGMVPSAAAMIAHVIYGQDMMVAELSRQPLVLDRPGIRQETGITVVSASMSPEWLACSYNIAGLKQYSAAVFERTGEYLQNVTTAELDLVVPTPIGTQSSAADLLASIGVVHLAEHTGEVSTLKGACGKVGLPF